MPRRRNTRGDDTGDAILRAALSAFSEKGFDAASTRSIASQAGVDHGLIRYHFGTKQKLWQAAVEGAFGKLEEATRDHDIDEITDERERIRSMVRGYVRFVASNPEFVRLMTDEGKRRGPRMRWIIDQHVKPQYAFIEHVVARSKELRMTPADLDPMLFVYTFVGATVMIFHQAQECRRIYGVDPTSPEVVERHADMIEALFLPLTPEPHATDEA